MIEQYLGETEEATKYLKMAIESDLPDDLREDALYALGTLSLMKGDLLTAVAYFSERIQYIRLTERRERGIKKVKGLIQERLSDEQIQELIEHHPTDFPGDLAMIEMAERRFNQGEISEAREYLKMFLKDFPDHPDALTIEQKLSRLEERPDQIAIGKFGCIAPLTGPLSGYGEKMIRGVKMAIEEYKRKNQRPFPTWTEVLEVIKALGYRRVAEPESLEPFTKAHEEPSETLESKKVPLGTWQD